MSVTMKPVFRDVLLVVFLAAVCCSPIFDNVNFSPDDFRYLSQVQSLLHNGLNIHGLTVITNSWSQMWWYPPDTRVVFLRPTVILSYLSDYLLWGLDARGYALTSVLIHVLCSVVVYFLFLRLLGDMRIALFGGLLFAVHPVHGEAIWYLPGRTDSLAALFWLLAFVLYLRLDDRKIFYPLSLASFFLALATKESTISLLPMLFIYDLVFPEQKSNQLGRPKWRRYAGYAVVFVLYYLLRLSATNEFLAGHLVYPYFYTPSRPGFPLHLLAMVLLYLFNLTSGLHTPPFFTADKWFVGSLTSTYLIPLVFAVLFLFGSVMLLCRNRRLLFLASFTLVTWLPASVTYTSERFLYLPSAGFIGILALVFPALELSALPRARAAAKVLLALLMVYYSITLLNENAVLSRETCPEFMLSRFGQAVDWGSLKEKNNVFIINYVDDYVCSVFLEDIIHTAYPSSNFTVRILTASRDRGEFSIRRVDDKTIEITSKPLFLENSPGFESRTLEPGEQIQTDLFSVSIMNASEKGVEGMTFTFKEPLDSQTFLILDRDITRFTRIFPQ